MKGDRDLITRLANIADALSADRRTQISDAAIRQLREEVETARLSLRETEFPIDYQHVCLIECIAELAYARTDKSDAREQRALMYINSLRTLIRMDLNRTERRLGLFA